MRIGHLHDLARPFYAGRARKEDRRRDLPAIAVRHLPFERNKRTSTVLLEAAFNGVGLVLFKLDGRLRTNILAADLEPEAIVHIPPELVVARLGNLDYAAPARGPVVVGDFLQRPAAAPVERDVLVDARDWLAEAADLREVVPHDARLSGHLGPGRAARDKQGKPFCGADVERDRRRTRKRVGKLVHHRHEPALRDETRSHVEESSRLDHHAAP